MRNRGSIVSVVTSSAGLELTFLCPVCGQPGAVTVTGAEAIFRCPDCRQAFQVTRGWELRWNADTPPTKRVPPRRRIPAARKTEETTNWVGAFLLASAAIVLPLVGVFWWLSARPNPAVGADVSQAAQAFTEAWLTGDREEAVAWIDEHDQAGFRAWWRSTRAVLTTGAGTDLRWGAVITDVGESQGDRAVVRVRFDVGRSEQQRYQTWKKTEAGWKLDLPRDSSPFYSSAD